MKFLPERKIGITVGACIAVAALALAPASSGGQTRASAGVLNVNVAQAAATIDPSAAVDVGDWSMANNLYVRLMQFAPKPGPKGTKQWDPARPIPYLAKSVAVNKRATQYTFTLRPAKFPDGTPIDAAAVKYSLERALTENAVAGFVITDGVPGLYKSIKVLAPDKLQINLSQPHIGILKNLAAPVAGIVEKKIVDEHGGVKKNTTNKYFATHVAGGGGPFILESYTPGVSAVLKANPTYFDKQPASQQINMRFISSDVTLSLQARSGQADVTLGISKQAAASLKSVPNVRVIAVDSDELRRATFVDTTPPLDNKTFREALTYAVPYRQILQKVAYGFGKLIYSPFATTLPGWNPALGKPRTFNLAKAKQLLAKSGVSLPVTLKYTVATDDPADVQIATILQSTWKPLGVNVELAKISRAAWGTAIYKRDSPVIGGYNSPGVWDPLYSWGYDVICHHQFNASNICLPAGDALYKKARVATTKAALSAALNGMVRAYNAASPLIVLYQAQEVSVIGPKVKSYLASRSWDMRTWG
ncbi:MAG TPA: ABC transporter substrate-binding protein [Gaiellaceae bacterium]|nr:ABC transporter substrate-binding protein [Gaiellaceae bacterium]